MYIEKMSGKNTKDRPVLQYLLDRLQIGDTVIIDCIRRLARSTKDFLSLVNFIMGKGCEIKWSKDPIATTTPSG